MADPSPSSATPVPESTVPARPAAPAVPRPVPGPDLLDRTWDFFASVRVATVLLFLLAAAAVAGSLIEQEGLYGSPLPPAQFYPQRYGPVAGPLLMRLGLTHAYYSWWFLTLLAMVGASLVVCSLQRGVPLYRAIHRPPLTPLPGFLRHLGHRITYRPFAPTPTVDPDAPTHNPDAPASPPAAVGDPLAPAATQLRRMGYRVTVQGERLFAEKGRWGRWGPYVLHLGILLILIGGLLRAVPGWSSEAMLWLKDGETARVPGAEWFIKNEKFTAEFYPDGRPKSYTTQAVVIENGLEVRRQVISMNEPLEFRGLGLYQSSYHTGLGAVDVLVRQRGEGDQFTDVGRMSLDLQQPAATYAMGSTTFHLADYFPDFAFDEKGRPVSRSGDPNNPALQFRVDGYDRALWFFVQYPEMTFDPKAPYQFQIAGMTTRSSTGLNVKKDNGLPVIWVGLGVLSLGTLLAFYLSHRRIWAMVETDRVLVAGQTTRDKFGLARDMRRLAARLPEGAVEQLGG